MLTLLRNLELYAPTHRGKVEVLLGGGSVLAVETEIGAVPAARTVDLGGARVIPGFVDPHVHLIGGGGEAGPRSVMPPVAYDDLVRAGVTSVVGVLGTDGTTRSPAALLTAVRALGQRGLSGWMWTGSYEVPPPTLTGSVRRDIVLVPEVLGAGEIAISDHRSSQPSHDELARLAADCHVGGMLAGKKTALHLHLGDGEAGLAPIERLLRETPLPAALFYPTHVNRKRALFDQACALGARGMTVDITAAGDEHGHDEVDVAVAIEEWIRADLPMSAITVSSDAGGSVPVFDRTGRLESIRAARPGGPLAALRQLLADGWALEAVLPAFGLNAARRLGLDRKGWLHAGADADLVVLDDSATPISVMARGQWLFRDGMVVDRSAVEGAAQDGAAGDGALPVGGSRRTS